MLNALSRMGQHRNQDEEDEGEEDIDEEDDEEEEEEEVVVVGTSENVDEKHCWVCFASEEDDPDAQWTHPCK